VKAIQKRMQRRIELCTTHVKQEGEGGARGEEEVYIYA